MYSIKKISKGFSDDPTTTNFTKFKKQTNSNRKKMTYATHKIHLGTPPKGLGLITVVLYFIQIKQFLEGLNLLKLVVFVKNTMDSFYFILMF